MPEMGAGLGVPFGEALPESTGIKTPAKAPDRDALLAAFAAFLRREDASPATVRAYFTATRQWAEWCQANTVNPAHATADNVVDWRDHLARKGCSPTTRKLKLAALRRFCQAAVSAGLTKTNPAEGIRAGKDMTSREDQIKHLSLDALRALLGAVPSNLRGLRDKAILSLMALHGLRRCEVQSLSRGDMEADGDDVVLTVAGKGSKRRKVYLRADVYRALREYLDALESEGETVHADAGGVPLFVGHNHIHRGTRLSLRSVNKLVNSALKRAGLKREGLSAHALRHTAATLACAGGAPIEQVRAALGHASLDTTSVYVHAVQRRTHNPANYIDLEVPLSEANSGSHNRPFGNQEGAD